MKRVVIGFSLALASIAAPAQAAVVLFTNATAFEAALGASTLETFDDTVTPGFTVKFASAPPFVGGIRGGDLNDRVDRGPRNFFFNEFTFSNPINGFGGDFDLGLNGDGQGLFFTLDAGPMGTRVPGELATTTQNFFGFVSDTAFTRVRINAGTQRGVFETFELDNLRFGALAVPEPGTWAMMIIGFGAVGASMRRRGSASTLKAKLA